MDKQYQEYVNGLISEIKTLENKVKLLEEDLQESGLLAQKYFSKYVELAEKTGELDKKQFEKSI